MMVIKTKQFTFSKQQYFGILFQNIFSKSWWAFGLLIVILIYQLYQDAVHPGATGVSLILGALPLFFLSYLVIRCWLHTNKKSSLFFAKRTFEIDNQVITVFFEDGTINKIPINNIVRVIKNLKYYRLFLSKKQFAFIPVNAFEREDDIRRFDAILKARKKPA
jgi:uncharacterized membrane protein YobD (UPF0266 family)